MKYLFLLTAIGCFGSWPFITSKSGMNGIDVVFMSLISVAVVAMIYTPQYRVITLTVICLCVALLVLYTQGYVPLYTPEKVFMNCTAGLLNGVGIYAYGKVLSDEFSKGNPGSNILIITIGIILLATALSMAIKKEINPRELFGIAISIIGLYIIKS